MSVYVGACVCMYVECVRVAILIFGSIFGVFRADLESGIRGFRGFFAHKNSSERKYPTEI